MWIQNVLGSLPVATFHFKMKETAWELTATWKWLTFQYSAGCYIKLGTKEFRIQRSDNLIKTAFVVCDNEQLYFISLITDKLIFIDN